MIINTDGVSRGSEHLDLALKDLQIIVNKLTNAKSISPVSCPYFDTVISQASGFRSNCESALNDCNTFIEDVTKDDELIDSILGVTSEESENNQEINIPSGYDMRVKQSGSLLGEKDNYSTTVMGLKEGYLVKMLDAGDESDEYALVICYRGDGQTGYIGYAPKKCLEETGQKNNVSFYVDEGDRGFAKTNDTKVRVREAPNGNVYNTVPLGTYVKLIGCVPAPDFTNENSWYLVTYKNAGGHIKTGFVRDDKLTFFDDEESMKEDYLKNNTKAVVRGNNVYFRSSGEIKSNNIIGQFNMDDEVRVLGENDEWYYVNYNGTKGYISKKFSIKQTPSTDIPPELNKYRFGEN